MEGKLRGGGNLDEPRELDICNSYRRAAHKSIKKGSRSSASSD